MWGAFTRFLGPRSPLLGWLPGPPAGGAPRLSPGVLAAPLLCVCPPGPQGGAEGPTLPQTETVPARGPTAVLSAERLKCHPAPPRAPHGSAVRGPRLHPLGPPSRASQVEGVWIGVSRSLRPLWCPGPAAPHSPRSAAPPALLASWSRPSASWPCQLIPPATLLVSCGLCTQRGLAEAGRISLCVSCSRSRVITEL